MQFTQRRIRNFAFLLGAIVCIALALWWQQESLRNSAFTSGYILIGSLFFLASYNIFKKLPFLPLGSSRTWMQLHIYVGLGSIALFMMHVQFKIPNGMFETMLAGLYMTVAGSGLYGLYITRTIPKKLTAVQDEVIFEKIPDIRQNVAVQARSLVLSTAGSSQVFVDYYKQHLIQFFEAPRSVWYYMFPSGTLRRKHQTNVKDMHRYLRENEQETCTSLMELIGKKDDLDFHHALQGRLKLWLFLHVGFTYALLLTAVLHGVMAHAFDGGMR